MALKENNSSRYGVPLKILRRHQDKFFMILGITISILMFLVLVYVYSDQWPTYIRAIFWIGLCAFWALTPFMISKAIRMYQRFVAWRYKKKASGSLRNF